MAASSEVTVPQNGRQGSVKIHPYLITLVRWCLSSVWSTATILLHRLMTVQLPQLTASKAQKTTKPRVPGKDHLDPEPRVECVVLHAPAVPTVDVIFVHGLYGSLGNTWRQGDWKPKYRMKEPEIVTLANHENEDNDKVKNNELQQNNVTENNDYLCNNGITLENINEKLKKILPNENDLITEGFYNNTLMNRVEIVDNYDTQAKFVQDLFKNNCDDEKYNGFNDCEKADNDNCNVNNECECGKECEVGCGCICDECYSDCWPRDWIKKDFPGARVISINYTSDPYLWRPIWIKQIKRLQLHERAEQMIEQLLALGVGSRPVVWVGHSKGGLFIKQIFCEAYEAYKKLNGDSKNHKSEQIKDNNVENKLIINNDNKITGLINNDKLLLGNSELQEVVCDFDNNLSKDDDDKRRDNDDENRRKKYDENSDGSIKKHLLTEDVHCGVTLGVEELKRRSSLWVRSRGFMFYSVPHRGSPLADIKAPLTARSVELLEISEDCTSTVELQSRWLRAVGRGSATVSSLVETRRTLMCLLWLRIVSLTSADAGVGKLLGAALDHREICKPSSRRCPLYSQLTDVMRNVHK